MLSRIADSLYWLNRYMERTDGLLRAVKTNYTLFLDNSPYSYNTWKTVLQTFTSLDENAIRKLESDSFLALHYLIQDISNVNSAKVMVARARENARGMQDNVTKEVWEQVNLLYHFINSPALPEKLKSEEALATIDLLLQGSILYSGITDTTMPRSQGWSFLNLGKYVERCLLTIELSDRYFQEVHYNLDDDRDILYWRKLLLSLSGYELHLKYYHTTTYTRNVADQVLFNTAFPRSLQYTLKHVEKYLNNVIAENTPLENQDLRKFFGRLSSQVQFAEMEQVEAVGLGSFLGKIRSELIDFNKLLSETFFLNT